MPFPPFTSASSPLIRASYPVWREWYTGCPTTHIYRVQLRTRHRWWWCGGCCGSVVEGVPFLIDNDKGTAIVWRDDGEGRIKGKILRYFAQ